MVRALRYKADRMQAQMGKCERKIGKPKKEPKEIIDIKIIITD